MRDLLDDVAEDARRERTMTLLRRFGPLILGLVFLALLVWSVFFAWKMHVNGKNAAASTMYYTLLHKNVPMKMDALTKARERWRDFGQKYQGTGFSLLSSFQEASVLVTKGRLLLVNAHGKDLDAALRERKKLFSEAAHVLKERTDPRRSNFFSNKNTWNLLHKTALIEGGYLLLQVNTSLKDMKDYFGDVFTAESSGDGWVQKTMLLTMAAYQNGDIAQAKKLFSSLTASQKSQLGFFNDWLGVGLNFALPIASGHAESAKNDRPS